MTERREAVEAAPSWQGWLFKLLGALLLGVLCAMSGYAYGQFKAYKEAEREYAEVVVAAFYDPDTRDLLFDGAYSKYVREELDKVLGEHGEVDSYTIKLISPGPAKTFIDVRVVRNGKQFDENVTFLAREISDFTSKPVGFTDSSQNRRVPEDQDPSLKQ